MDVEGDSLQLSDFNALMGIVTNKEKAGSGGPWPWRLAGHICNEVHHSFVVPPLHFPTLYSFICYV